MSCRKRPQHTTLTISLSHPLLRPSLFTQLILLQLINVILFLDHPILDTGIPFRLTNQSCMIAQLAPSLQFFIRPWEINPFGNQSSNGAFLMFCKKPFICSDSPSSSLAIQPIAASRDNPHVRRHLRLRRQLPRRRETLFILTKGADPAPALTTYGRFSNGPI